MQNHTQGEKVNYSLALELQKQGQCLVNLTVFEDRTQSRQEKSVDILALYLRPISIEFCIEKTNLWGQKIICREHCKQSQANIRTQ